MSRVQPIFRVFSFLFLSLTVSVQAQTTPIAFIHASVIDGLQPAVIPDATVVVENGRIVEVTRGGRPPIGAQVIDLEGKYLLPGLIDGHAHIASLAAARRALSSGVTTARSGNTYAFQDVALREMVKQGAIPGPEIFAAVVFVTPDLEERILADPRLARFHKGVETEEDLRYLIRINVDRGVDVIKTRGTARAGLPNTDPRQQVYSEAQLRIIVDEAARHGKRVMVHAHGNEGALAAVKAGAWSIEHGTYLTEETLKLMKEKGTFLVPTYATIFDLMTPGGEYDDVTLQLGGQHMEPRAARMVQTAYRMGIKIVASTDADYLPQGLTRVAHEVTHFVRLGMTAFEAIRSATAVAAECLEIQNRTGTIKKGLEADLIVVEQNPLIYIESIQDPLVVMSNGVIALNRLPFGKN